MNLFEMVDFELRIQPEAYALVPFKKLWDRDKTKLKEKAIRDLAFVYFMADYKSDYSVIVDFDERTTKVKSSLGIEDKWQPDDAIKDAIAFYKEQQRTITILLLEDIYHAIDNLRKFYREVDLTLVDDNGKPIHDVSKLTRAIQSTGAIVDSLKKLEDTIKKERETSGLRAGQEKGIFEDGDEI